MSSNAVDAPLRTVVVSAVRHATDYARLLIGHPRIEVVAVAEDRSASDVAQEAAHGLATDLGVPLWNVDELSGPGGKTGACEADLAVICSEPTRHAQLAVRLLDGRLHVLVDKPVATTLDDARAVVDAMVRSDRRCAVITRALLPAVVRLQSWVDAGWLGLPRSIDIEFLASGRDFDTTVERPELVVDPALSGGGELMNFLGYAIDQARAITGCEPLEVHTEMGALFSALHAEHGVEDVGVISMLMTNGVVASLTAGRAPVVPSTGFASSTVRVIGSQSYAEIDTETSALRRFDSHGGVHDIAVGAPAGGAAGAVIDALVRGIMDGVPLPYDVRDAAMATATIEAAYLSARTAQPASVGGHDLLEMTTTP